MPTRYRQDSTPVVQFDPRLEVSPFAVFRQLQKDRGPLLLDVRSAPQGYTLQGAETWPGKQWEPPPNQPVVLFDDDGAVAVPLAQHYQELGHPHVKALLGGLDLWRFSLDPEVVGSGTYLIPVGTEGRVDPDVDPGG